MSKTNETKREDVHNKGSLGLWQGWSGLGHPWWTAQHNGASTHHNHNDYVVEGPTKSQSKKSG